MSVRNILSYQCVYTCVRACMCVCVCVCVRYYRKVISSMQKTEKSIPARKVGASTIGAQKCRTFKKTATSYGNRPKSHSPDAVNIEVNKRRFGDRLFGLCSYSKSFGRGRLHRPARASRNAETSKAMKSTGTCREAVVRTSIHDTCGVRTHALTDWRLKPAP